MTRAIARTRPSTKPQASSGHLLAVVALVCATVVAGAQEAEWREVDNPYQEDVEYTNGTSYQPRVSIDGVRWRSFIIDAPERDPFTEGATVDVDVRVEFENRRAGGVRVLAILLLEDGDGNPLDRIEIREFKVASGRIKDRSVSVPLSRRVIDSVRRVYLFFEVME